MVINEGAYFVYGSAYEFAATGNRSTAVRTVGDVRLEDVRATAGGPASAAIAADGDLYLLYGTVHGPITATGSLSLDLADVDPIPENAIIIGREARWLSNDDIDMGIFGFCAVAGHANPLPATMYMDCVDIEGVEDTGTFHGVPLQWETAGLDLSTPGTYTVYGTPQLPGSILGLDGVERKPVTVQIVESGKLWLTGVANLRTVMYLQYLEDIVEAEAYKLHHSRDGETWSLLGDEGDARIESWGTDLFGLQRNSLHYFQLEVIGGPMAGRSNILTFWLDEKAMLGNGGDRDGTGQGDNGPLPPPVGGDPEPPDPPKPPPGGENPEPPAPPPPGDKDPEQPQQPAFPQGSGASSDSGRDQDATVPAIKVETVLEVDVGPERQEASESVYSPRQQPSVKPVEEPAEQAADMSPVDIVPQSERRQPVAAPTQDAVLASEPPSDQVARVRDVSGCPLAAGGAIALAAVGFLLWRRLRGGKRYGDQA